MNIFLEILGAAGIAAYIFVYGAICSDKCRDSIRTYVKSRKSKGEL